MYDFSSFDKISKKFNDIMKFQKNSLFLLLDCVTTCIFGFHHKQCASIKKKFTFVRFSYWVIIGFDEFFKDKTRLLPLHKKWTFPLRISSVNVTKSAVSCGFGHICWRNPWWKTSFFVQSKYLHCFSQKQKTKHKYMEQYPSWYNLE